MLKMKFTYLILLSSLISYAQNASIKAVIIDKSTNESIIGATAVVQGTGRGTTSDYGGVFELGQLPSGLCEVVISYTGFKKLNKTYTLSANEVIRDSIFLEEESLVLADVVVVGRVNKQNAVAVTMLQKKSASMLTGISNEDIKKSPDRSTSDVLKRVSGASIVDQKFVIIRGLADRYNNALLNGNLLPSTEPDKRAFSFDLFPSSVLSNLVIFKTATPDLPGEFAGGIVQVNTKEVPDNKFSELNVSVSTNSISSFKPYSFYQTGSNDWMGFDNNHRVLNPGVTKEKLANFDTRLETSKLIPNDWAILSHNSMMPSMGLQISGGTSTTVSGKKLGIIAALGLNNSNRISELYRADFNIDKTKIYQYSDLQVKRVFNNGGMLNGTLSLNAKNKISFNNIATIVGDDQYLERTGTEIEAARDIKAYSMLYTSTALLNNQLTGEHELSSRGTHLKWSVAHSLVSKKVPSYRRMSYLRNEDASAEDPYIAFIPAGFPSPNYAGRFYSDQNERFYTGRIDLNIPINQRLNSFIKTGINVDLKDREFDARVFGYTYAGSRVSGELLTQDIGSILDHVNINPNGFVLKESTNPNDSYTAESQGIAGYIMIDHYILPDKLRITTGLRMENFNQKLNSFDYGGREINIDESYTDVLPSLSLVYSLNDKSNIRLSGSGTIIRPNFRELAPFSFYDFNLSAAIVGNPELKRTKVWNADLKYETFFQGGYSFSTSVFYKRFNDPIEQIYETLGAGTKNYNFENAANAENYGIETEFRIDLGQLYPLLDGFTMRANGAIIHSMVNLEGFAGQNSAKRSLQSQSPYLLNLALGYQSANNGFSANVLYNIIGRRLWLVGSNGYLDTYEAPRNLLDLQITQQIYKNLSLKLTLSDLLNEPSRFYQDQNESGHYDKDDTLILETNTGFNAALSIQFKFD